MTLVPAAESGNSKVQGLDGRRVFEILGPAADADTSFTDFEGRKVVRSGDTLKIGASEKAGGETKPAKAHFIVRWRFVTPHSVTVNGSSAEIKADKNGIATVEFDDAGSNTIAWQ